MSVIPFTIPLKALLTSAGNLFHGIMQVLHDYFVIINRLFS